MKVSHMAQPPTGKARLFLSHVVPAVIRPLRVLWNEIIGFFFIVLAAWATPAAIRNVRALDQGAGSIFRAALSLIFAGLMVGFAIYSFLRALKISRS